MIHQGTALGISARRRKRYVEIFVVYVLLGMVSLIFLFPFIWMILTALKDGQQVFAYPPRLLPDPAHWENFVQAWQDYLPFTTFLRNTAFLVTHNVVAVLVSSTLIAYGFARFRVPEAPVLFALVLAAMMIPEHVLSIPTFLLFAQLGWVNTFLPLTVPWWFGDPFIIFLLRQFFMTLPRELEDAATLDGCGFIGLLRWIILPLSKPALVTAALLLVVYHWNNFYFPLIFLGDTDLYTLALGIGQFRGRFQALIPEMMAVGVLMQLPIIVLFFFAQRYFTEGLALTGLRR